MGLSKIPAIRPSKGTLYTAALFLATFIFWFTRVEPEPSTSANEGDQTKQGAETGR